MAQLKRPLLEMEAALRKSAFAEDWDPLRASQGGKQAPQVPFDLLRLTVPTQGDPAPGNFPFSRRGPSRWIDPEPAGKGTPVALAQTGVDDFTFCCLPK